jgi:1-acyl-sn-glycerol-3-phosphate acyltransferase
LVLIFPEGTVNRTKTLVQFKEGLVTIAYLANVPIYPIYIDAKHRPLHCQNIMLGKSLHLRDHFHTLNTKTSKMMTKMVYDYVNLMKKKLEEKLRK